MKLYVYTLCIGKYVYIYMHIYMYMSCYMGHMCYVAKLQGFDG